ncbi:MAG: alpha/beta fold hydrolase [Cyanobacteria bacterium P01_D01_bin.73]
MNGSMKALVGNYQFHSYRWGNITTARPLLLLHGFMGCGEDFEAVVQAISRLGGDRPTTTVYALDLPGHGQTQLENPGQLTDYGIAATAHGVRGWTQLVQPGPWAIAGYSMGGRLALYLAANFPNDFPVTVAIGASPGLEFEGDRQTRRAVDNERAKKLENCAQTGTFEEFLKNWYQMPLFSNLATHPSFETMLDRRRQNNPQLLAYSLRYLGLGQQPFLLPQLANYTGRLDLVVGEHDGKFIEINRAIARHCPRARLTIIPDCGHTIPLENPVALAQILAQTLL